MQPGDATVCEKVPKVKDEGAEAAAVPGPGQQGPGLRSPAGSGAWGEQEGDGWVPVSLMDFLSCLLVSQVFQ